MNKTQKILLIIFASLAVLFGTVTLGTDAWVSRMVQKEVAHTFSEMDDVEASVGRISIFFLSGTAIVHDLHFATKTFAHRTDSDNIPLKPGMRVHVPAITVSRISYADLFMRHHVRFHGLSLNQPEVTVYLDEKHPDSLLPTLPKDTTLRSAGQWLSGIQVENIEIENMRARLRSTRTELDLHADSLTIRTHDFSYSFADSSFTYNDSVYQLLLASASVIMPDGLMALEAQDLQTANEGALVLGRTHLYHTIPPKKLADKAKEPTSWIDLTLNRLSTSAFNPIHKVLAQDYTLDSLRVDVRCMHVNRDERHAPRALFPMPQDVLRKLPFRFNIKQINALLRKVDVELTLAENNCGQLHVGDIRAQMANVTNHPGAIWYNKVHAPFGDGGIADMQFNMYMDKAASFDFTLCANNVEANTLNPFIRPIIGITCECHIDQLDADYHGDRQMAKGDFCLQYHGFFIMVHKEDDVPFKVVTKHVKTITQLANTLIPKSNPTAVDVRPRGYYVQWKRDDKVPFPLYLFGPCIDGTISTMLPGLYVHKQTKK